MLLLWPGQGDPAIVLCKGEDAANRDDCRIKDMRTYKEFVTSPIDLLADAVVEKGLAKARLGVERTRSRRRSWTGCRNGCRAPRWSTARV